jgi:foldase protein PrsA
MASTIPTASVPSQPRRRATPAGDSRHVRRGFPTVFLLLSLLIFALGIGMGMLVMRQRYRAREIVVAVNGKLITKEQFYTRLEQTAGANVLQQLVGEELRLQYATKNNKLPTNAEVEQRLKEEKARPDIQKRLAAGLLSEEQLKHNLRLQMAMVGIVNKGVQVTDAEIRRFYQTNIDKKNPQARYYTPETVQLAAIVTETQSRAKQAAAALAQGSSWENVAKQYSQDMTKDKGGILPPVQRGRTRVGQIPGLEAAVFGLKIEETLGPRRFGKYWWILRCLDKRPATTIPFETVKAECRTGAMLLKGIPANQKQLETDFASFQKQARIQAFWAHYKDAVRVP